LVTLLTACALYQARRLDRRYSTATVRQREVASLAPASVDYWTQIRPVFEARCVVCHACYDAPCQLKLGSLDGIDRGSSKQKVYDALRLREAPLTRLFEDATSTAQWRDKDFHPVLNERDQTLAGNREGGMLLRLLEHKQRHPVVAGGLLPEDVDLRLRRDEKCPTVEELPRHLRKHPQWGMPYGLPGLSEPEHAVVTRWLEEGAVHTPPPPLPARLLREVARWEAFLNGDELRAQLASRYVYEHLFLAHVYFGSDARTGTPQFFELVRSKTPPGEPVVRVATRRPYDDPGVARVYYRFAAVRESIVAKLHLPYRFDAARMDRWRELLFDADFPVDALPSYAPEVASNPFVSFRAIPVPSRYRFMLDEAEFTLMGFIKGAVCRGSIALNVIDDQFWIFFVDPDVDSQLLSADFLYGQADNLRMPAAAGSNALPMTTWLREALRQKKYMEAKRRALGQDFAGEGGVTLPMLWDGDGDNPNAALTVFRHFDSASVVRGMVGEAPKTSWVLGYALLERIHYLLVAGFDVYGNVGHQLSTRSYMDFLRMEAEFGFLAFLPPAARHSERDFWYRGTNERIYREVVGQVSDIDVASGIEYRTEAPKAELYDLLHDYYRPVDEGHYAIDPKVVPGDIAGELRRLGEVGGTTVSRSPEVAFLHVPDAPRGARVFSIIHNDAHLNISSPLNEADRRAPMEDTLTVARGFVGTYPNALYEVPRARLAAFVDAVAGVATEADYAAVQVEFGIRRTDPRLWPTSDALHELFSAERPIEAGVLDLSRLENR
jgi:hypothetical protein